MPFEMDSTISIHAPREGGDFWPAWVSGSICDFNPRPPRGGRHVMFTKGGLDIFLISIHAPPRGGRLPDNGAAADESIISIHAPREGGDRAKPCRFISQVRFQSTPPARGATSYRSERKGTKENFNPRPPRGGRRALRYLLHADNPISIHAPCEGGDPSLLIGIANVGISIHAPREGGDPAGGGAGRVCSDFNPRPPRGGRR